MTTAKKSCPQPKALQESQLSQEEQQRRGNWMNRTQASANNREVEKPRNVKTIHHTEKNDDQKIFTLHLKNYNEGIFMPMYDPAFCI